MITLVKHKKGDFWRGMTLTFPFSITGYAFKADFKTKALNGRVFGFDTEDNTMTINTVLNKLTFVGRILDSPAYNYISDIQMTPPNGEVETIDVINLEITQDITD